MKIGILETGLLNEKVAGRFDPYPVMFTDLLDSAKKGIDSSTVYSVVRGEMPDSIDECEGWLITGSRFGAYENLDWMLRLQDFIRDLSAAKKPLVGICFGHQIIALALGGAVEKSSKGWGIGLHEYQVDADVGKQQAWLAKASSTLKIHAFHQDQITKLVPESKVFLSSKFCPFAGIVYGDSIMTIQAHPEIKQDYEIALLDMYGGNLVPADVANQGRESIDCGQGPDAQVIAEMIAKFFLAQQVTA